MFKTVLISVFVIFFMSCITQKSNRKSHSKGIDQSTPEATVLVLFDVAQSGKYSLLKNLCHDYVDNDGDTQRVCDCNDAAKKDKTSYQEYFAKGSIRNVKIIGNEAEVEFTFGPDGTKEETMNLEFVEGKWYLKSF